MSSLSDHDMTPGSYIPGSNEPYETMVPKKRKAECDISHLEKKTRYPEESLSTAKWFPSIAKLPAHVWQRIFLFLDSNDLGLLLRVNRTFHSYLTDVTADRTCLSSTNARLISSNYIWKNARAKSTPSRPSPLMGCSELEMLRLIGNQSCQFCGKEGIRKHNASPWRSGPGENGVRAIWPFAIRSCGNCLRERCDKESSLLFSPTVASLLTGIPYIFVTETLDVVTSTIIEKTDILPLRLTKWFLKRHVEEVSVSLGIARERDPNNAEEWFKELEEHGMERLRDSRAWERWESQQKDFDENNGVGNNLNRSLSPPVALRHSLGLSATNSPSRNSNRSNSVLASNPQWSHNTSTNAQNSQINTHFSKAERSIDDVNEAKAARKARIEQLCRELDPPINPEVLRHMVAFDAAVKIPATLTDSAWEILKPRLLAEREKAEGLAKSYIDAKTAALTRPSDRHNLDMNTKELKEAVDREWEESQRPMRQKLAEYAERYINDNWSSGEKVNKDNCHTFAAQVLVHVRQAIKPDIEEVKQTESNSSPTDSGSHDQSGAKLALENMKWVFDHFVKPITEKYRKDLFLCPACEGNFKHYGFEGIVQHYAAKHTHDFSVGNVVVHWREAEWPEMPPFQPEPSTAMFSQFDYQNSAYFHGGYSRGNTVTPHMATMFPYSLHTSPFSVLSNPSGNFHGPFPPPQAPPIAYSGPGFNGPIGVVPNDPQLHPQGIGIMGNLSNAEAILGQMAGPNWVAQATTSQIKAPVPLSQPPNPVANFNNPLGLSEGYAKPGVDTRERQTDVKIEVKEERNSTSPQPRHIQDHIDSVVQTVRSTWNVLSKMPKLPNSVMLFVTFQRVQTVFKKRFGSEPSLTLFREALNTDILKFLTSISSLSCSICHDSNASRSSLRKPFSSNVENEFSSLISLLSHFQNNHLVSKDDGISSLPSGLDWTKDMILLPNVDTLTSLGNSSEMSDEIFELFSEAFPDLFPSVRTAKERKNELKPAIPRGASPMSATRSALESRRTATPSPRPAVQPTHISPEGHPARQSHEGTRSRSPHYRRRSGGQFSPVYGRHEPVYYPEQRVLVSRDPYGPEYYPREPWDYEERIPVSYQYYRDRTPEYIPIQERQYLIAEQLGDQREEERRYIETHRLRERPPQGLMPTEPEKQRYNETSVPHTGEGTPAADSTTKNPLYDENAAERFLNNFVPGEDSEDTWNKAEEGGRQSIGDPKGDWQSEVAPSSHINKRPEKEADAARNYDEGNGRDEAFSAGHLRPPSNVETRPGADRNHRANIENRSEMRQRNAPYRRRNRYSEQTPSRFQRYFHVYREHHPYRTRVTRPQSRYQRYEEQRRELERQRSMTPEYFHGPEGDSSSRRDTSVDDSKARPDDRPAYTQERPDTYVRVESQPRYAPASHSGRYSYAEQRPVNYIEEFVESPYQVIRIPDTRPTPRGYVSGYPPSPRGGSVIEYLPYDRASRAERYYNEDPYYLPPERRQSRPEERSLRTRDSSSYRPQSAKPEGTAPPATPGEAGAEAKP